MTIQPGTKTYEEGIDRNAELIRSHTLRVYEKLWMENLSENLATIKSTENEKGIAGQHGIPALIVGGGPSLWAADQLKTLSEHEAWKRRKLVIIATDRALESLLEHGIEPDFVCCLDAEQDTGRFFKKLKKLKATTCLMSVLVHSDTIRYAQKAMKIFWYTPVWDNWRDLDKPSVTRVIWHLTGARPLDSMGNVGGFGWYVANLLGASQIGLIGIDFGYPENTPIQKTQYYEGYKKLVAYENAELVRRHEEAVQSGHPDDMPELKEVENCYRVLENPDTGVKVLVGLNWDVYRTQFLDAQDQLARIWEMRKLQIAPTYNLSPISSLYGPKIITKDLKEWLDDL